MSKSSLGLKKLTESNELLSNLQTEIEVTLQKRDQLRLDQETETKRQLTQRKQKLAELDSKITTAGLDIVQKTDLLKDQLKKLQITEAELESSIVAKNTELEQSRTALVELNTQIEGQKGVLDGLQSKELGLHQALSSLNEQIGVLQGQLVNAKSEIEELNSNKDHLKQDLSTLESQFNQKKRDTELVLYNLGREREDLEQEVRNIQGSQEAVRKDLAARLLALDDREKVLTNRENKLKRGEVMLRQNAGLLNL